MFAGQLKESRIDATIMRVIAPDEQDPRPWQMHQCPHCNGIFWAWVRGTISYWHRNPIRRAVHWINSFGKG
jgi:hypothetical protein